MGANRVVVTFVPQEWTGRKKDICVQFGEPRKIDVTMRILKDYTIEELHDLSSNSYEADQLIDGLAEDHNGPFEVEDVEESVCGFFEVEELGDITEEMLATKRDEFQAELETKSETTKLRLILDVEYLANGTHLDNLKFLLGEVATGAMSRGMITGNTPAEVECWQHRVEVVV